MWRFILIIGCLYVILLTTVEGAAKERVMHDSDRQTVSRKEIPSIL